jgi:hypothetical protein
MSDNERISFFRRITAAAVSKAFRAYFEPLHKVLLRLRLSRRRHHRVAREALLFKGQP